MKTFFLIISICLVSQNAFADKILSPGQIYTTKYSGEVVACTGGGNSNPRNSYTFLATGQVHLSDADQRDPNACSMSARSFQPMLDAKEIAISNGKSTQCQQGYSCEVLEGRVQYERRGSSCIAKVPFRATLE